VTLKSTRITPTSWVSTVLASVAFGLCLAQPAAAAVEQTPFDLVGPTVNIQVTRGTTTLPIAEVPVMAPHDRIKIVASMPDTKNARYIMVAAFLRGPTDPPPENWFYRCDTWKAPCDRNGLEVEIPEGAQQMMLFFAPQTGGDYRTLVAAVRGKPGAFVRAAQQLRQAGLDRARLDYYLAVLRDLALTDPGKVKAAAPLIARSLAIKIDEKCLDRIPALQAPCLTQNSDALILNDGHGESLVSMVTTGVGRDLAIHAGETSLLGSGNYSSVIGSILDLGRLMDTMHTAQYQYIPALPSIRDNKVVLMLNTPPSFHNPMSVLVAVLPAIERPNPPILRTPEGNRAHCTAREPMVLAVEGDALVYSTRFAHNTVLHGQRSDGTTFDLPAIADAPHGGYLIADTAGLNVDESQAAQIVGYWGFDRFEGPKFRLASPRAREWQADATARAGVVAGREITLPITGEGACLDNARLIDNAGHERPVPLTISGTGEVELRLPLGGLRAGSVKVILNDLGGVAAEALELTTFQEPSRIDRAHLHLGDTAVTLEGEGLAQIADLEVGGLNFIAEPMATPTAKQLRVVTEGEVSTQWSPGSAVKATAHLRDGRSLATTVEILSPRPQVHRLALSTRLEADAEGLAIRLGDAADLPIRSTVTFSLQADSPPRFLPTVRLETEVPDADVEARLDLKGGGLTLVDRSTLVATLDLTKAFGASSFGPIRYRVGLGDEVSDWQTLGRLVRLPQLRAPICPPTPPQPCSLPGSQLYLLAAVAANPDGSDAVTLDAGFPGDSVAVPHPKDGHLYLRLRDDPTHLATIDIPPVEH
jgi:hypothetical protein